MKEDSVRFIRVMIPIVILFGVVISYLVYKNTFDDLRAQLLLNTRIIAESIPIDYLEVLTSTDEDYDKPEYRFIVNKLIRIIKTDPKFINIYIFTRDENHNLYFLIHLVHTHPAIPITVPEYVIHENPLCDVDNCRIVEGLSAGLLYDEATPSLIALFDNPIPYSEFLTDRYGFWMSGLVPIIHPVTGETLAVVGLDVDAWAWIWNVIIHLLVPIILIISFIIMIILSIKLNVSRIEIMNRSNRIKEQRDILSNFTLNEDIAQLDSDSTFNTLIQIIADTLKVDDSTIWLLSESQAAYFCKTCFNAKEKSFATKSDLIISKHPDFFEFMNNNNIAYESDVAKNPILYDFYIKRGFATIPKSLIYVNIWSNRKIIGIISAKSEDKYRVWQPDEITFMETVSAIINQVITKKDKEITENKLINANKRFGDKLSNLSESAKWNTTGLCTLKSRVF